MYGVTVTYTQNNFLNDCTAIYMTKTVFWKGKKISCTAIQLSITMILLQRVRKNSMYGSTVTYTQNNFQNDQSGRETTMTLFQKVKQN